MGCFGHYRCCRAGKMRLLSHVRCDSCRVSSPAGEWAAKGVANGPASHQTMWVQGFGPDRQASARRSRLSGKSASWMPLVFHHAVPQEWSGVSFRQFCQARGISESVTPTGLCSSCALSPAPQRACRSGRDSQSFSYGGGTPHTRDDSSSR